jgi:hypothetical protein
MEKKVQQVPTQCCCLQTLKFIFSIQHMLILVLCNWIQMGHFYHFVVHLCQSAFDFSAPFAGDYVNMFHFKNSAFEVFEWKVRTRFTYFARFE